MPEGTLLSGEPLDTRDEIMFATYDALQKYGYAGLSIQRIADESSHSKSTFYHHYDGKEDLLLSFVEFILTSFKRHFEFRATGDPEQDVKMFVGFLVGEYADRDRDGKDELLDTYLSLQTQAIHDEKFREKFTETSDRYIDELTEIIQQGIDQGVFKDVDAHQTAFFLLTIVDGLIVEKCTRTDDPGEMLYDKIEDYIDNELVADE